MIFGFLAVFFDMYVFFYCFFFVFFTCNSAFEQVHLEPWRYINAFIIYYYYYYYYYYIIVTQYDTRILSKC